SPPYHQAIAARVPRDSACRQRRGELHPGEPWSTAPTAAWSSKTRPPIRQPHIASFSRSLVFAFCPRGFGDYTRDAATKKFVKKRKRHGLPVSMAVCPLTYT